MYEIKIIRKITHFATHAGLTGSTKSPGDDKFMGMKMCLANGILSVFMWMTVITSHQ